VTGLEGTALGVGQAALKAVAVAAAKSLAGRATFRWAVWWRVRGRTEFPCPWRAYVKWLKTINADELTSPMEEIQGPLAIRLDQALSAASGDWGGSSCPWRMSSSLAGLFQNSARDGGRQIPFLVADPRTVRLSKS
jgi:hypothetical protein